MLQTSNRYIMKEQAKNQVLAIMGVNLAAVDWTEYSLAKQLSSALLTQTKKLLLVLCALPIELLRLAKKSTEQMLREIRAAMI